MSGRKKVPEGPQEEKRTAVYTKKQLTASKRYQEERDLLEALLEEKTCYSLETVEQRIEQYKKGKVK